jgi:hypothetical protein
MPPNFLCYTFAENSTTIANHGSDGGALNGTANRNTYYYQQNGYGQYGPFNQSGDMIAVPSATNDNDPATRTHSFEIGMYYNGHGSNATYAKLWDKGLGGIYIGTQMSGGVPHLIVYFATTGTQVYWVSSSWYFTIGHYYYVEVSWQIPSTPSGCTAGNVHVHVAADYAAPAHIAMNFSGAGSGSWNSPNNNVTFMNYRAGGYNFDAYLYIVREYNVAINWDTGTDWNTDVARWTPKVNTSISIAASNYNPPLGTTYQIYGTLQTTTGVKIAGAPIYTWYTLDEQTWQRWPDPVATTDVNGYYSFNQVGVPLEDFWTIYDGDASYNGCSSSIIQTRGISVNATAYPGVITVEAIPIAPSYGDYVYPNVVGVEAAPINPSLGLGINATVIGIECAPGVVYPDILGQYEFAFPQRIQVDAEARSMLVSLLSTQVLPPVLEPEMQPRNYDFVEISQPAPATSAGSECGVLDPTVLIDNPLVIEVDAILEDIIEADAEIDDAAGIGMTINENIELELEVTTE